MIGNKNEFKILLAELKSRLETANVELNNTPAGKLSQVKRNGKMTYFQVVPLITEGRIGEKRINGRREKRISINKRPDIIRGLARKAYLETEIEILKHDIELIEKVANMYIDNFADDILTKMPERIKQLPETYFFKPSRNLYDKTTSMLAEQMKKWAEEPFEQSTYKPELKDKTTARGIKVRTKSEVIVSEKLDSFKLPHRYEQMIYIDNYAFSPDFTILTKKGVYYWEHAGKVNDPRYLSHHKWKMGMYERAGIVPWKNLIVTYDDENGGIDTRIIEAEIRNKLL